MHAITIAGLSYYASDRSALVVEDQTGGLWWWRQKLELRHILGHELVPVEIDLYPHVLAASFDKAVRSDTGEKLYTYRVKDYVGRFYGLGATVLVPNAP